MVFIPKLNKYNINTLVALSNYAMDEFSRSRIKNAMIDRILMSNTSMLFLVNKFISSKTLLKEAYADVILMIMKDNDYYIDDAIVNEILSYASLDSLMYYGADSLNYEFNIKCKEEFYRRGREIEDKIELQKKRVLIDDNCKGKGDRYGKYKRK